MLCLCSSSQRCGYCVFDQAEHKKPTTNVEGVHYENKDIHRLNVEKIRMNDEGAHCKNKDIQGVKAEQAQIHNEEAQYEYIDIQGVMTEKE